MSEPQLVLNPSFRFLTYKDKHYGYMPTKEFPMAFMVLSPALRKVVEQFESPRSLAEFEDGKGAEQGLGNFLSLMQARGVLVPNGYVPEKTDPGEPNALTFLPTTRCNLRCTYCYAEAGDHASLDLDPELAEAAVRNLVQMQPENAKAVSLSFLGGGEPTMSFELIKKTITLLKSLAQQRGLKASAKIVTNGTFNKSAMDWILENDVGLAFSLDGPQDIQNGQRPLRGGGPSYDRISANIRRYADAGKKVHTRATVMPQSLSRLREIVEHAIKLGSTSVHLEPLGADSGRAKADENAKEVDKHEFADAFLDLLPWALEQEIHIFTTALLCLKPNDGHFCGAEAPMLVVTPSGMLSSCPEVCEDRHPASDAFIWGRLNEKGEVERDDAKVAKLQARMGRDLSPCKECFLVDACGGGCAARAFGATGDAFGHDQSSCGRFLEVGSRIISAIAEERLIPGDKAWLPRRARCDQGDIQGTLVTLINKYSPLRRTREYKPIVQLLRDGPVFTLAPGAKL